MKSKISKTIKPMKKQRVFREVKIHREQKNNYGSLIDKLFEKAANKEISKAEMATELGVTYGYINQLANGIRLTNQASNEFLKSCSKFLGMSIISVKIISGNIPVEDFDLPTELIENSVDQAIQKMLTDPRIGLGLRSRVTNLPLEAKTIILELYEKTTALNVFELEDLPPIIKKIGENLMKYHTSNT